jgi:hypothetical protein
MTYTIKKNTAFPTVVLYAAIVLGTVGIFWFLIGNTGIFKGKAGLSVGSVYGSAVVYLDGEELGKAPVELDSVDSGEHVVMLKGDSGQYEVSIEFLPGAQVVINRDLGISDVFSSGQDFWMEESKSETVFSVVSEPGSASVYIDGSEVGKTPYSSTVLSEGDYDLRVDLPGYESQTARINIKKGYKLNVSMKMFPLPVLTKVEQFEGSVGLYNVALDNTTIASNPGDWVLAMLYWNQTRGINLVGLGISKEAVFDYFLDYKGNLYAKDGHLIREQEGLLALEGAAKGAYLGRVSDGEGLTTEAKESYEILTGSVLGAKMAQIEPTGLGWLRVRSEPGLDSDELGKATVGESYKVVEEGTGWVKIQLSDEVVGWVSSDHVKMVE